MFLSGNCYVKKIFVLGKNGITSLIIIISGCHALSILFFWCLLMGLFIHHCGKELKDVIMYLYDGYRYVYAVCFPSSLERCLEGKFSTLLWKQVFFLVTLKASRTNFIPQISFFFILFYTS